MQILEQDLVTSALNPGIIYSVLEIGSGANEGKVRGLFFDKQTEAEAETWLTASLLSVVSSPNSISTADSLPQGLYEIDFADGTSEARNPLYLASIICQNYTAYRDKITVNEAYPAPKYRQNMAISEEYALLVVAEIENQNPIAAAADEDEETAIQARITKIVTYFNTLITTI